MPENAEHTSTEDVLQSSELAARLLRRLIVSPGVIDTRRVHRSYARLTELITHAHPLLHDLLARYNIDDDSAAQDLPLVMDQPWMVNLNTYLTNNSSTSSTTTNNSYFANTTTNQSILQSTTSSSTNTQLFGATSEPAPSETFRVSRRPADRRQNIAVEANDVVLNPMPKHAESLTSSMAHVEGQPLTLVKREDRKHEPTSPAPSPVPAPTKLTLAQTTVTPRVIQREIVETEMKTSRLVLKDSERIKEVRHFFKSDNSDARPEINTPQRPPAATEIAAAATVPTLPLAQEQLPAAQFQSRPPQLVWRKSVESQTLRDFVTEVSSSSSSAAVRQALDSLPMAQTPPSNQFVKSESSSRVEESPSGEEITTEGMLRRISKMLLIERERRGY